MIKGKTFRNAGSKIGRPSNVEPKNPKILICTECPYKDCTKGNCARYKEKLKGINDARSKESV